MFLLYFFVSYFISNAYIALRIRGFFSQKNNKNIATLLTLLSMLNFPLSEILSHKSASPFVEIPLAIAYFTLPSLLYVFFTFLFYDIFLIINIFAKFIPNEKIKSAEFRKKSLIILLTIPVLIVIAGAINYRIMRISEYTIEIPRKSSNLRQLRIVAAADTHLRDLTSRGFVKKFTAKINAANPDIVLLPGDIIEGDLHEKSAVAFADELRKIKTKYGVFATLGNHELYGRKIQYDFFTMAGITLLRNKTINIDNAFYLIGRDDANIRNRKSVAALIRDTTVTLPMIMMDHRPTDLNSAKKGDIDIQVSGHTHNGQLFPINIFIIKHIYKINWGYKKMGNTNFFVTCGVRGWGPPVKTSSISEIMVINVNFID